MAEGDGAKRSILARVNDFMKTVAFLALAAIGGGGACSSGSVSGAQTLPTATNTFCVTPSADAQDVVLPMRAG